MGQAATGGVQPERTLVPPAGEARIGTFLKTNTVHVIEILGTSPLQFAVVDAEHAPFDRAAIDLLVLAGRAAGLPVMVRVPDIAPSTLLSVLDAGAAGLLVPHVDSAAQAREIVSLTRARRGVRGFSSSTRAAGYGTLPMAQAVAAADGCFIMAQIESKAAVAAAHDIAAVEGIDGLFVGRADLALSMGELDSKSPTVMEGTKKALDAARAAGKVAGMAVGTAAERHAFAPLGANWFIVGSDQSLLRQGAQLAAAPA
ncbi:MAG: aldolase/citrate lyase family protein [Burkholderiaceae bacterium]